MKRTVQMAKSGVPSSKPGAPPIPHRSGKPHVIRNATVTFIAQGAKAASKELGGGLRAKLLLPLVLARAKFLVRQAKRFDLEKAFLAQLHAAHVHENIVPDGRA